MKYTIAVIKGDGIGPEITEAAVEVLNAVGLRFGHEFTYTHPLMGGAAIDAAGVPLPDETIALCKAADAVLLGAVGGPKWDSLPGDKRPEKGLLGIRSALGLYANLRPAILYPELADASPLKADIVSGGIDLVVVRELIGGIYFGDRGTRAGKYGPHRPRRLRLSARAAQKGHQRGQSQRAGQLAAVARHRRESRGRLPGRRS